MPIDDASVTFRNDWNSESKLLNTRDHFVNHGIILSRIARVFNQRICRHYIVRNGAWFYTLFNLFTKRTNGSNGTLARREGNQCYERHARQPLKKF